jgi:hypothetical protein
MMTATTKRQQIDVESEVLAGILCHHWDKDSGVVDAVNYAHGYLDGMWVIEALAGRRVMIDDGNAIYRVALGYRAAWARCADYAGNYPVAPDEYSSGGEPADSPAWDDWAAALGLA